MMALPLDGGVFPLTGNPGPGRTRGTKEAAVGRTVDRALTLLEAFREEPSRSLVALARAAGLAPSTTARLLAVLQAHRFVERDPMTKQYMLGLRAFELAGAVGARLGLRGLARPALERLVAETGETVHLVIADGGEAVAVEKLEGPGFFQPRMYVGRRTPLHCTAVGKAMLAHWRRDERARLLAQGLAAFTPHTITSPVVLERELRATRERGYALNREEYRPGSGGVAAPVFDASGQPVAAIGIAAAVDRLGSERIPALARAVIAAAHDVSIRLGWPPSRVVGGRP